VNVCAVIYDLAAPPPVPVDGVPGTGTGVVSPAGA